MSTEGEKKPKTCFVIGPIGDEGTEVRTKADWLLQGIVKPVLEADPFNYVVKRSDDISEPGLITDQVISWAIDADLVIADLTGHNPNAFYELAIRHMAEGRTIHMVEKGGGLPFDIKDYRAIVYKLVQHSDVERAKKELAEQVTAVEKPDYKPENPITKARGFQDLSQSSDSKDKMLATVVNSVSRIDARLDKLEQSVAVQTELSPFRRGLQRLGTTFQPSSSSTLPPVSSTTSLLENLLAEDLLHRQRTTPPEKTLGELITPESVSIKKSTLEKTLGEILTPESEPKKKKND